MEAHGHKKKTHNVNFARMTELNNELFVEGPNDQLGMAPASVSMTHSLGKTVSKARGVGFRDLYS